MHKSTLNLVTKMQHAINGLRATDDDSPTIINIPKVTTAPPARKTIFVGIAGGTASGKTTVADEIFALVRVGHYK